MSWRAAILFGAIPVIVTKDRRALYLPYDSARSRRTIMAPSFPSRGAATGSDDYETGVGTFNQLETARGHQHVANTGAPSHHDASRPATTFVAYAPRGPGIDWDALAVILEESELHLLPLLVNGVCEHGAQGRSHHAAVTVTVRVSLVASSNYLRGTGTHLPAVH